MVNEQLCKEKCVMIAILILESICQQILPTESLMGSMTNQNKFQEGKFNHCESLLTLASLVQIEENKCYKSIKS